MKAASYEELAKQLDDSLGFCSELGLDDHGRFKTYRASFDHLIEVVRGPRPSPLSEQIAGDLLYLIALVETSEFSGLLPFLRSCDPDLLRRKLRDVLRGPELPSEEDQNSNQARNLLFELNLASKLWHAGLKPELGEHPDVACVVDGKLLLIECKRPMSVRGARESISRARQQLLKEIKKRPAGTRGVVALSMSKVLNRGDKLFAYDNEAQASEGLHQQLLGVTGRFGDSWQKLPDKIVGVVFHVITPAVDRMQNMHVAAQHTNLHQLAREGSLDARVFRAFSQMLEQMWNVVRNEA